MAFDLDAGFQYASRLRGPAAKMNPADWTVNWADAPWPFKVYEGGARLPLPLPAPNWAPAAARSPAGLLGSALFFSVGCTRIRVRPAGLVHSAPERPVPLNPGATLAVRRAIASGGALYPAEVYVWATTACAGISAGRYHYNPARHELVELAKAPAPDVLCDALGLNGHHPELAVVVTHNFWKNFFKYADFGYRLGSVDVGIAAARLERMVRASFGVPYTISFDFDDQLLNRALGLDGASESAYAVITSAASVALPAANHRWRARVLPPDSPRPRQKSHTVKRSADFDRMHASILEAGRARSSRPVRPVSSAVPRHETESRIALPRPSDELLVDPKPAILARTSNGESFTTAGRAVPVEMLSALLREAAVAVKPRLHLFVLVQRVADLPQGSYRYDDQDGSLIAGPRGDLGLRLQACSNVQNINVDLSAFTLHIADGLDFRASSRQNRAYRIQQMRVGAVVDATLLAAAALGLGAHPMLGFNAAAVDALHAIDGTGVGALAQVCIGVVRPGHYLEGSIAP